MNRTKLIILSVIICSVVFLAFAPPVLAKQRCCGGPKDGQVCQDDNFCSPAVCGGLCNPLGSNTMSILEVYIRLIQLALGAVSLFGVMMFLYGGLLLLTSVGNPEKVKKAKDTVTWAVAGIALIILSASIVKYIFDNFQF